MISQYNENIQYYKKWLMDKNEKNRNVGWYELGVNFDVL